MNNATTNHNAPAPAPVAAASHTGCAPGKKKRVEQPTAFGTNNTGFAFPPQPQPQPQPQPAAAGVPPPPPSQPQPNPFQPAANGGNGGNPTGQQGASGPFAANSAGVVQQQPQQQQGVYQAPVPAAAAPGPPQSYPAEYSSWTLKHWTGPMDPGRVEAASDVTLLVLLGYLITHIFSPILALVIQLSEAVARKRRQSVGQVLVQYSSNFHHVSRISTELTNIQCPLFGGVPPPQQQQQQQPSFGTNQPQFQPPPPQQQQQHGLPAFGANQPPFGTSNQPPPPPQHQQEGPWPATGGNVTDTRNDGQLAARMQNVSMRDDNNGAVMNTAGVPTMVGGAAAAAADNSDVVSQMSYEPTGGGAGRFHICNADDKFRRETISAECGIANAAACEARYSWEYWSPILKLLYEGGFQKSNLYTTKLADVAKDKEVRALNYYTESYWGKGKGRVRENISTWWKWMFFDGEMTDLLRKVLNKKSYKGH